jgi:hypothetical protein
MIPLDPQLASRDESESLADVREFDEALRDILEV